MALRAHFSRGKGFIPNPSKSRFYSVEQSVHSIPANTSVFPTIKKRYGKGIIIAAALVIIAIIILIPKNSVIGDTKQLIFEGMGDMELGDAVARTLEDEKWTYEKVDKNHYEVTVQGFCPSLVGNLSVTFDVYYSGDNVYGKVVSASYDNEVYTDAYSTSLVLAIIYGQQTSLTTDTSFYNENSSSYDIEYVIDEILSGNMSFIDFETSCEATIYTLPQINSSYHGQPRQYALCDLDGDLLEELLVEYNSADDTAIITCIDAETWVAYYTPYRGIVGLKDDGTCSWSNSASHSGIHRFEFSIHGLNSVNIAEMDTNRAIYKVNGQVSSQEECKQVFIEQHQKADISWFIF